MSCFVEMEDEARKKAKLSHEVTVRDDLSPQLLGAIQDVVNAAIPAITTAVVSALGPVLPTVPTTTSSGETVSPTSGPSSSNVQGLSSSSNITQQPMTGPSASVQRDTPNTLMETLTGAFQDVNSAIPTTSTALQLIYMKFRRKDHCQWYRRKLQHLH